MAIDARIALGVQPVQLENPLDAYARVSQVQSMQQRNRLTDLMFQDRERAMALDSSRRNALTAAMNPNTGEIDGAAYTKGLAGIGDIDGIQTFQRSQAEQQKAMREAEKERVAAAKAQVELIGQVAGAANDPQSYAQGRAFLAQQGIDVSGIPEQYDPAYVQTARAQALSAAQQLEQFWKAREFDLDEAKFGETRRHNQAQERTAAGNLAVAQANLGVARERLSLDKTQAKGQVVQTENGPVLVDPRTGQATPVTVNGQQIPSKEVQQRNSDAKSVVNLLDMAEPLIDQSTQGVIGAGVDSVAGAFGKSLPGAQAAAQLKALEGMLISKMPKMSGPQSDKDVLLYRQMAGQIGDVTVPRETRKAAIRTIREITQRNADGAAGAANNGIKPGTVMDGYRFKGGNPADRNAWEKM